MQSRLNVTGTTPIGVDVAQEVKIDARIGPIRTPPTATNQTIDLLATQAKEEKRLADLAAVRAEQAIVAEQAETAVKNIVASHSANFERLINDPNTPDEILQQARSDYADFKIASAGLLEMNAATDIPKIIKTIGIDSFTNFIKGVEIPTPEKLILIAAKIVTSYALEKGAQAFKVIYEALPAVEGTAGKVLRGIAKGGAYFVEGSSRAFAMGATLVTRTSKVITTVAVKLVGEIGVAVFRAAFAVVGVIADVAAIATGALQICSSFQFGGVGVYFPDPYASAWVNAGILPFAPGSVVMSKSSIVYGLEISSLGQNYIPGDFVRITTGGIARDATQYFQAVGALQPALPYDVQLEILPMPASFTLKDMMIVSQGAGFTGTPSIGVTGGFGDTGAPPQWYANMTCSTLGPITHTSNDTFLYPPTVHIEYGTDMRNPAKALAVLDPVPADAAGPGSGAPVSRVDIVNGQINRYLFNPAVNTLPRMPPQRANNPNDRGFQNFMGQVFFVDIFFQDGVRQGISASDANNTRNCIIYNSCGVGSGIGYGGFGDYWNVSETFYMDRLAQGILSDFLTVYVDPPAAPGGRQARVSPKGQLRHETDGNGDVVLSYLRVDSFIVDDPGSGYLSVPRLEVYPSKFVATPNGGILGNPLVVDIPAVGTPVLPRKIKNIYVTDHGKGYKEIPAIYVAMQTLESVLASQEYSDFVDYYKALPSSNPPMPKVTSYVQLANYAKYVQSYLYQIFAVNNTTYYDFGVASNYANILYYLMTDSNAGAVIGTTVGSTGTFSQWSAFPSSFGYGYVESSAPVAIQDYYINRIDVVSSQGSSGASGYLGGPPRIGLTGGGGYNCIYDVSLFPNVQGGSGYTNNVTGLRVDVVSGGYYEIEPLSEFGNGEDYSGVNVVIIPSTSDVGCDGLAFAEPIINGSIVTCEHSAGVAAYSSMKTQLPFNGVTVSATVYPMDGNGVSGAVEVDGWHYSYRLNAYVIDHVTVTNPGSGYTEPPLIKVTFTAPKLHVPAYAGFYARIGGPLASVRVANSATGFNYPPTVLVKPYNQASNTSPYIAPIVSDAFVNISNLAGTIANVSLTNQRLGFSSIPRIVVDDLPASGIIPSLSVRQELTYIHVDITDPGAGYINPPYVVITDKTGQGSGAIAKAIMNIPGKAGQSGPSGYEVVTAGDSGPRHPDSIFSVSGPSGSSGYSYQPGQTGCVSGVAFINYGNGYLGEVDIQFVRNPADSSSGVTGTRDAMAKAKVIHSSALGPPSITTTTTDGNGEGVKANVSVNTGLFIAGITGTQNPQGVLEIPHIIDGIQSVAFANQPDIEFLTFEEPSRCWEIQEYAFSGCTGLSIAWLPESIQRIGDGAFENCPNLVAVVFKGFTGPALGEGVFNGSGGVSGTNFYFWQDKHYVTSYGGHSGWYDVNYLGGTGRVNNLSTALLNAEPLGIGGMLPLISDIVGTTGTTAKSKSIACDSQGNAYYSDTVGSLYQVDVYGNQTQLQDAYDIGHLAIHTVKDANTNALTDRLYYLDFTGTVWYQQLPWPLDNDPEFPNPHPQTVVCQFGDIGNTGCTHMTVDNDGYIYVSAESQKTIYRSTPDGEVITWKTLTDSFPIGGLACDSYKNLSFSYPTQGLVYTYANTIDSPKILTGSELTGPEALVYDKANNLYISCGNPFWASGIRILTSDGNKCSTYAAGFYTRGGIAINNVTGQLLFNDDTYLCQVPVSVTDMSFNLLTGLASHDYNTVIKETGKTPGKIFALSPSDVININSTLPAGSQVPLPTNVDVVEYICPNTDGSISAPVVAPNKTVTYATSFRPGSTTIVDVGKDRFTATYNDTTPPTISFVNIYGGKIPSTSPQPSEPQTLAPGASFTTYSGANVILYSIGMTIIQIVVGDAFIPGVQGDPPPVCKPKQQGIDYSQYLSGAVSSALYPQYKEGPVSGTEWIRRQRLKRSVKFGTCPS
jgi:hypothetical protein